MGRDIEILEEQINKLAQDKEAKLANPDLTDEERQNVEESFNRALEGFEQGLIKVGLETKAKIQSAITNYETMVKENEAYIKAAEEEIAKRKAEIDEELAKENPDMGVIEAKTAQIKALEKRIKGLKSDLRKTNNEIKEQKKLLIPLMHKFGDKIFSKEEIADLEKLDKKIQAGKRLSEKNKKTVEETPVVEEVAEEPVAEEAETPVAEEVVEEPVAEEVAEEPVAEEEPVVVGTIPNEAATKVVAEEKLVEEVAEEPVAEEEIAEEKPVDMKKEFRQLYIKAKKGKLNQKDYDRLVEIMSDAENYDKYGVSTGLFNNKAKVVLKAMGKFATKKVEKTVVDGEENFGVSVPEKSKTVVATGYAKKWSTIEELIDSPVIKLKAQVICEDIIAGAEEKGVENLSEEEELVYGRAIKYTRNFRGFRTSMNGFRRARELRREKFFGWFSKRKDSEPAAIAEADVPLAPPNEDLATSLRREVKETSDIEAERTITEGGEPEVDFAPFEIDG